MDVILMVVASIFMVVFLSHMFFYWYSRSTEMFGHPENQKVNCYLSEFDFAEKHKIVIHASPEKVFAAIHNFDMRKSKVINTLVFLRSIPYRLNSNREPDKQLPTKLSIDQLTENGSWILLEEVENQEVIIGFAGKFWQQRPTNIQLSSAADFINFNQTGYSKVAWNLYIERNDDGTATLSTETRILCLEGRAKSSFRLYWAIIRPYSGWIRLEMLKMIKERAENH
ncbi:hypothetical protein SAMN05660649_01300 [Desulfotomaculum arcticum]|uniref:Uncharacterized protein n=2 Tax=Desulfotruncus TaxID=2867377 RepID=A0A1I2QUH9_9FIRM|nr:hypothetical protein SAMN05660649_01300 [Desulfotomaculum arcticum] [Desulfotruncus arcticus DSM 17038]